MSKKKQANHDLDLSFLIRGTYASFPSNDFHVSFNQLLKHANKTNETAREQKVSPHFLHLYQKGFFLATGRDERNGRYVLV